MPGSDPAWQHFESVFSKAQQQERREAEARHLTFVTGVLSVFEDMRTEDALRWHVAYPPRVEFRVYVPAVFTIGPESIDDAEPLGPDDMLTLHGAAWTIRASLRHFPDLPVQGYLPALYAARRRRLQPCWPWLDLHLSSYNPWLRDKFLECHSE